MNPTEPSQLFPEFRRVEGLDEIRRREQPYAELALSVARLRGSLGLTQTEFAKRLRTSQPVIARLESGKHGIQISLLNRIARAFGATWRLGFEVEGAGAEAKTEMTATGDALLDAFNKANVAGDFAAAHRVALKMGSKPSTPRRELARAIDAFNLRRFPEALKRSEAALKGDLPAQSQRAGLIVAARALLAQKRAAECLAKLESAGNDLLVVAARCEALIDLERNDEALELAAYVNETASENEVPAAAFLNARVLWHAGRAPEALEKISSYRTYQPTEVTGRLFHGSILGYLGDRFGAEDFYERALELFAGVGDDDEALRLYATTASRLGRWKPALETAGRYKARKRAHASAAAEIALQTFRVLDSADDVDNAADLAEKLRLLPDAELRSQRSFACALRGDFIAAVNALGTTVDRLSQASPEDQVRCALAYVVAGKPAEAYPILKANEVALSDPDGKLIFAQAALAALDTTSARRILKDLGGGSDVVSVTATMALDLVSAIEREGQQQLLRMLSLGQADTAWSGLFAGAPTTGTRDSSWEGPRGAMGVPIHESTSVVLDQFTSEQLSVGLIH